jgi:hypothetical protein
MNTSKQETGAEVLHVGRSVAAWREIVAGLRIAAQFAASPHEAAILTLRARDLEASLPLQSSPDSGAK